MRIGMADFVGAVYSVPQNPVLDAVAKGTGDFVGGKFSVPQNPVLDALGLGSLVPSAPMYAIPLNSVMAAYNGGGASYGGGLSGRGTAGCGQKDDCGCGCGGGMGQVTVSTFTAPFTNALTDIQAAISAGSISPLTTEDWLVIAGTGAAVWYLFGRKGRR